MKLLNQIPLRALLMAAVCISGVQSAPQFDSERWENETGTSKEYALQTSNKSTASNVIGEPENSSEIATKDSKPRQMLSVRVGEIKQRKIPSLPSDLMSDDIQFKENKPLSIRSSIENTSPPVFFTQHQKNQFYFPRDNTNPFNRLQATVEEVAERLPNVPDTKSNSKESSSEETGTSFFSSSSYGKVGSKFYNAEDAVKTMDLTLDIVKASNWGEQNIVFSPLSICNVLALLMLGSQGQTFDELSKVLNVQESPNISSIEKADRFHEAFRRLLSLLSVKSGKNVSLEIANEIFNDKHFTTQDSYISNAQKYYQTSVESFDFGKDGKKFLDQVNEWVRRKTNNKIKSIIDEPPSPTTTLAFVNAVYFKGNWEVPFIERITRKKDFFVKPNETMEVQMMTNVLTIPYLEQEDYTMVGIPYKGNRTGFFVILPKSSDGIEGLKGLEEKLTAKVLIEKLSEMQLQKVALKIPKMKIATDGHMKDILSNIGIPSMFDPVHANFSRMSSTNGLYVSAVHHRAVMEVNEKGTEAAAVTIGTGDRTIDELPIPFVANKPFIFFIYHVKANTVLFWGRVTRPQLI